MAGSDVYVGQLMVFAGNFVPLGWFACNGQLVPISQYEVLYQLLGTSFGGDGISTFGLPNLQGRVAIGAGQGPGLSNYVLGQIGGSESVTLTANQLPLHTHAATGSSSNQNSSVPNNNLLAGGPTAYTKDNQPDTSMAAVSLTVANGGSLPHENRKPFLTLTWCIAWTGIFPSQG